MIALHGAMTHRGDSKCIEELQKVAIGVSENSACLLALPETLRQQTSLPVPVLNMPLFARLSKQLTDAEHALQVLDLARDVPRPDTDVQNAVAMWLLPVRGHGRRRDAWSARCHESQGRQQVYRGVAEGRNRRVGERRLPSRTPRYLAATDDFPPSPCSTSRCSPASRRS